MGRLGVRATRAHLLLLLGGVLVVAGVYLLACLGWALLTAGVLVVVYALLLVDVPAVPPPASATPADPARMGR